MRKLALLIPLLLFQLEMPAQLLNVEDLRLTSAKDGWYGQVDFNFRIRRNKVGRYMELGLTGRVLRKRGRDRWILLGAYGLTRFRDIDDPDPVSVDFKNLGYGHARYNRVLSPLLRWEVFAQGQFDQVQEVKERFLTGTGPRFALITKDTFNLYLGLLYMFEYEENTAESDPSPIQRNHRASAYLDLGYQLNPVFGITSNTYFQPRLDQWGDFRLSNNTNFTFSITKVIAFDFRIFVTYDSEPPITVPNLMYSVQNGISVRF